VRGKSPLAPLHFTFSQNVGEIDGHENTKTATGQMSQRAMMIQPRPFSRSAWSRINSMNSSFVRGFGFERAITEITYTPTQKRR
jgi:hypothetical protein